MQEVVRVTLDNEMDLVLAHKRSMKLAELTGLSLSAQTTFATAVSEVARTTIDNGKNGCLVLGISNDQKREKYIIASIKDESGKGSTKNPGLEYAKKLVNKYNVSETESATLVELYFALPFSTGISTEKIEEWKALFLDETPVSPYDEIKRKNEELRELAQKLQESESKYKTLTNALPLSIFTLDKNGKLTFANEWFMHFTGVGEDDFAKTGWKQLIHADDLDSFALLVNEKITAASSTIKAQCRLKQAESGDYFWHLISISPLKDEKENTYQWIGYGVDIHAQKVYEATLQDNRELKEIQHQLQENKSQLEHNVQELNRSNQELQQFAFVASHDLQEPVRKVAYYSDLLMNKYTDRLDEKGKAYLQGLHGASARMRSLISDVLAFSQVNRAMAKFELVDLNEVVKDSISDYELTIQQKHAEVNLGTLPHLEADRTMMVQVFENLISNALKYAQEHTPPRITIDAQCTGDHAVITVADNGIGFDDQYAENMFRLFQRLHSRDEYDGTGLGLAICRKITELHQGTISAAGQPNNGAVFTLTLPLKQPLPPSNEPS